MNVLNVSEEATQNSDEQNNEVAWLGLTTSEEDNASLENDYEDIVQETMWWKRLINSRICVNYEWVNGSSYQ